MADKWLDRIYDELMIEIEMRNPMIIFVETGF